ncbi:putative F-box protein At1g47790 [Apium graveolens]|uniref:putative F-box protein At1g47790 n=1 Tax=Apium graveolens TaxID=4045 RepID=UPI003D7959CC
MAEIRPNPTLSDDLINQILLRVPVKSLLSFQLVCKTWLSLINDPAFVKAQLLRANTVETEQVLIMNRFERREGHKISLLQIDSRQIQADLKFPYECSQDVFCRIVGSANGIVCVAVDFDIYFWNPATRQSKLIPSYIGTCNELYGETLGFGYDPISHDFKVVRLALPPSVEVYSANKNVWRKVPDPIDDTPVHAKFDVCVNGFLCGIGCFGMVVFDLNKEVLNCAIKLPVHNYCYDYIIKFKNSIAFIIILNGLNDDDNETDPRLCEKISMWSLDDDACLRDGGVEPSWTIMFSIDFVNPDVFLELYLGYFNNGDLLLLIETDGYKWISCNADRKEAKIFPLSVDMANHFYRRDFFEYRESLVSLAGFKQVN